jgi:hypothetical protein
MNESESARLVQAARLEVLAPVAQTMRQAGALHHRYSADHVSRTARQVVAAWAMAVEGAAAVSDPFRVCRPPAIHRSNPGGERRRRPGLRRNAGPDPPGFGAMATEVWPR